MVIRRDSCKAGDTTPRFTRIVSYWRFGSNDYRVVPIAANNALNQILESKEGKKHWRQFPTGSVGHMTAYLVQTSSLLCDFQKGETKDSLPLIYGLNYLVWPSWCPTVIQTLSCGLTELTNYQAYFKFYRMTDGVSDSPSAVYRGLLLM